MVLMQTRITVLLSVLSSLVFGCSTAYTPDAPERELHAVITPSGLAPIALPPAGLDGCFTGAGALVELGAVNNNDQTNHGALLTFGISPGGIVAAAGEDGTLKFWTMENTLVGVADPGVLTYGPELGGAPITDLAFTDEMAIAGDIRGLVQELGPDGSGGVVGGTMPDVPIASVAFDRATQRLAHAQGGPSAPDVTPLVIQSLDGTFNANIEDTMSLVTDLAYAADGTLVVGGTDGTQATLEIRGAGDPNVVLARPSLGTDAEVIEVAAAREGATVVVATNRALFSVSGATATRITTSDADFRSVDLTPSGDFVLTVDANGLVRVLSTVDGHEVAHLTIETALGVRVNATGDRVVVGGSNAMLHVLTCR